MIDIDIKDVIISPGIKSVKFRRTELNDFCDNHEFRMDVIFATKKFIFYVVDENSDPTLWEPIWRNIEKEFKCDITFKNPDDELMFKLIY